jgi:hypothetical protein
MGLFCPVCDESLLQDGYDKVLERTGQCYACGVQIIEVPNNQLEQDGNSESEPVEPGFDNSGESEKQVRGRWAPKMRKVFFEFLRIVVIVTVSLWVMSLIRPAKRSRVPFMSSDGLLPPRAELVTRLIESKYSLSDTKVLTETLRGRRLRKFSYFLDAEPEKQDLAKVDLWCKVDDPERVVAISSFIPGNALFHGLPSEEDAAASFQVVSDNLHLVFHGSNVRRLVLMSSWIYIDLDEARKTSADGSGKYVDSEYGFTLEVREKKAGKDFDGKPFYDTWVLLKDGSWE